MKKATLIFIILCINFTLCTVNTSAQSWQWARGSTIHAFTHGAVISYSLATDLHGNVYSAVNFVGDSVSFGPFMVSSGVAYDTANNFGALVKYDSSGNVLSGKGLGGGDDGYSVKHVTVDKANNIYVSGTFRGPTYTIGTITLTKVSVGGNYDYFVAKYGPAGNLIWAQNNSGVNGGTFTGVDIKTDDQCNVYLAGDFGGTIHYGTDSLVSSTYGQDVLLVKLDSAGHYQWCRGAGGGYQDRGVSLCLDRQKNIYISGYFGSATFIFASDTLHTSTPPSSYYDNFILKYDSTGTPVWARRIPIHDIAYSQVCTDSLGYLYTISTFSVSALSIGTYTLHPYGSLDYYVAKYSPDGDVVWAKHGGGSDLDYGFSIIIDPLGKLWISGGTRSTVITYDTTHLSCDISTNGSAFLAELDTSGNMLFTTGFRNGGYNIQNDLAGDPFGNIFIAGSYINGNCIIGIDTLPAIPTATLLLLQDIYVTKLGYPRIHPNPGSDPLQENSTANINSLAMYPNPGPNELTIVSSKEIQQVAIYNLLGQAIFNGEYNTNKTDINVAGLPKGMYLIRINGSETRKFVKE